MNERERRVVRAFVACVRCGEMSSDYAMVLLEDDSRYGWMSDGAKRAICDGIIGDDGAVEDAEAVADAIADRETEG